MESDNQHTEEIHKINTPIIYNNNDLASNTIDTIILSGGGYLGIVYTGLFLLLEKENIYSTLKTIYGVSVGGMFGLLILLKYSFEEVIELFEKEIELSKIILINNKEIFNLPDTYGFTEPRYIEQSIKRVLELKGFNPYITLEDLYNQTGIELNLGITLVLQNKFMIINHKNRPDLPVWLAVRMTANLPIIFNPVKDHVFNDFVYDGGHLNNNPIKNYLDETFKHITRDASTQTDDLSCVNDKEADPENETVNLKLMDKPPEKKINKYRMNFICIDLKLNRNPVINAFADLDQVSFMDYLISVISKFTYNQDSYKPELQKYILSIDCMQFGNLFGYPFNISIEKIKEIGLTSYHIVNDYYLKTLCGS